MAGLLAVLGSFSIPLAVVLGTVLFAVALLVIVADRRGRPGRAGPVRDDADVLARSRWR